VVKPRYSVKSDNYEKFEKRYLPAKEFGVLVVSTPKGMMSHNDARKNKLGGRLIAYCY
jgi:small subunit ribosomal protein S8